MSDLHPAAPDAPTAPTRASSSLPTREPWFTRRRREAVDRAAQDAHAELVRLTASGRAPAARTATSTAVVAASVVVLVLTLVAVGLLARATFADKGLWGWVLVVLGWVVVAHVLPRPARLEGEALDASTHPATHRLVSAVAESVGTPTPRVVAVDGELSAHVVSVGWRMRPAVVLGLPLWTMLRPEQRLALLAHELGHLRGRDTAAAALVSRAHQVLERLATLLVPLPRDAYGDIEDAWSPGWEQSTAFGNRMGTALLRVVSLPFVALLLGFERLVAVDAQRREYVADLAAARVAGPAAVVRLLFTVSGLPGIHTTVAAAVRRGDDPFDALEAVAARPALGPGQLAAARRSAAESGRRWDDSHPRDDLRISLLEALPGTPAGVLTGRGSATATLAALAATASVELAGLRRGLSRSVRDDLLESYL